MDLVANICPPVCASLGSYRFHGHVRGEELLEGASQSYMKASIVKIVLTLFRLSGPIISVVLFASKNYTSIIIGKHAKFSSTRLPCLLDIRRRIKLNQIKSNYPAFHQIEGTGFAASFLKVMFDCEFLHDSVWYMMQISQL